VGLLKVQTAQNVEFDFSIGNAGQRILAALLDLIVTGLYIWFMQFAFSTLLNVQFFQDDPNILFFFIIVLPTMVYLPVCEYFWNGRTVGKYLLKLRVVRFDGSSATLSEFILRWLVRTIDVKLGFLFIFFIPRYASSETELMIIYLAIFFMIIPFPLVGILFMLFTKHTQRLGDLVANTVVVRKTKPFSLEDTILKTTEQHYQPVIQNVMELSDKDIYIIKNVLDDLKKNQDYTNAIELSEKAKRLLGIKEAYKPVELLRTILNDYNHMAKQREVELFDVNST
jgi:uncharacterized RDD family membrane protein YckC